MKTSNLFFILLLVLSKLVSAQTIQVVVDNDYALYLGSADGTQLEEVFQVAAGADQFLLGTGGTVVPISNPNNLQYVYIAIADAGGQAALSGAINGINLVDVFDNNNADVQINSRNLNVLVSPANNPSGLGVIPATSGVATTSYSFDFNEVQNFLTGSTSAGAPIWVDPTIDTISGAVTNNAAAFSANRGQRVGFGYNQFDVRILRTSAAALGLVVPEPSTTTLLGFGVLGFILRRKR